MKSYNPSPCTVGEHVRKVRIERKLFQKDVAAIIGVSEDSVAYWENGRTQPKIWHYPAIIAFLGYYPFPHETATVAGKLTQIRYCNGLGYHQCAKLLHVSFDAIKRWEQGKHVANPKMRMLIESVWYALPNKTTL